MNNINVQLIKQTYKMDDGNLISGVQVVVAPMIYKFISFSKQKLDLLSEIRPSLYQWFINSPDGSVVVLSENNTSVSHLPDSYTPINNDNSL